MRILKWLRHLLGEVSENAIYMAIDRFYVEKAKEEEMSKKEEDK